jgi:hypothetical protein
MNRLHAALLTFVLLVAGGAVHGYWSERWRAADDLEYGVEHLPKVPLEFDGWKAEERESKEDEFAQAGARGYWTRMYRKDGKELLVILMIGRPGRMSVHTPEVCYRGAGFEIAGPPKTHEIFDVADASGTGTGTGTAKSMPSFWTATFRKTGVTTTELQLYWAWNGGDGWMSPKSPRWEFAGRPALCKLYLSQLRVGAADEHHVDEFLQKFVPLVDSTLAR